MARAQPGVRIGEYDRATAAFQLATPTGVVSSTGIAGLTLSGGLVVPFSAPPDDVVSSQHLAVVVLPEGTSRPEVRAALANDGIQTSVHYPPIHTFTRYAGSTQRRLPVTDAIAERLLTLPLFGHMTEEQNDLVAERLLAAL